MPRNYASIAEIQAEPSPEERPLLRVITVGDLQLDPRSGQVTTPHTVAHLTPTQTAIFHFLMDHADVPYRGVEIVRLVWGPNWSTDIRHSVRQHIRAIRLKIEPDPSHPQYLTTRYKFGYVIASKRQSPQTESQIVEAPDPLT